MIEIYYVMSATGDSTLPNEMYLASCQFLCSQVLGAEALINSIVCAVTWNNGPADPRSFIAHMSRS